MVSNLGHVCQTITFESPDVQSSYLYIQGIWVKFVYEGHWVKVKVTGAKKIKNPHFRNLPSARTPVLQNVTKP